LAVTTETDFGVSTPVIAAEDGCVGELAADLPSPHPDNATAENKIKSAHVGVFKTLSPG
jgi:hypothetical protein